MRMSNEGRRRLTAREGVRLKAYLDSVGIWTIGIGHTSAAGPPKVTRGLTITRAECDAIFKRDLVQYEDAVNRAVKVPLAQHQFDACVSLCYNIGSGGFGKSTVVKRINAGDMEGAAKAFMLWSKPAEIIGRRKTEVTQFLTPYRAAAPARIVAEPIEEEEAPVESESEALAELPSQQPPIDDANKISTAAPEPTQSAVKGDPQIWNVQRRLKDMNYNPGGMDGRWGDMTSGAISAFLNARPSALAAPTSLEMFMQKRPEIEAELSRAEAEGHTRRVSVERSNADQAKVEEVAPEAKPVNQSYFAAKWTAICGFFATLWTTFKEQVSSVWNFFFEHKDGLPSTDSGLLSTAAEWLGSVPAPFWIALGTVGVTLLALRLFLASKQITQSVQTGARQ